MCEAHVLIEQAPPRGEALEKAKQRSVVAHTLANPQAPVVISSAKPIEAAPAKSTHALAAVISGLDKAPPPSAAVIVPGENLLDVLLASYDSTTEIERKNIVARLARVLDLPGTSDIAMTRRAIAELISKKKLQASDVAPWLALPSLAPKILAALHVLDTKTVETVALEDVNRLFIALKMKQLGATQDWALHAFGPRLCGQVYEALKRLGYTEQLPVLFANGLGKYLAAHS